MPKLQVHTFENPPDASESDVNMLACLLLWEDELYRKHKEGTILPFEIGIFEGLRPRIWAARLRIETKTRQAS